MAVTLRCFFTEFGKLEANFINMVEGRLILSAIKDVAQVI